MGALGDGINRDPIGEAGGMNLYVAMQNDSINSTDALGLRLVIVPGATWDFICKLSGAEDRLCDTDTGKQLVDQLAEQDVYVSETDNETSTGAGIGNSPEIRLNGKDPNFIPDEFNKNHPSEVPQSPSNNPYDGPAVVLGHELGHALHPGEEGNDPANVRNVENPIREQLGIPARPTYHGSPVDGSEEKPCDCP